MSTLSVCMIVRDEAERLPRCLDSVRGLADQVVVVDTGSRDGTLELLARDPDVERAGFTWCDDFSAARNAALERARGDWVLVLDADEVLEPPRDLARWLEDERVQGWYLTVRNLQPPGDLVRYEDSRQLRLFRNRPEFRYRGPVHEQISPALAERGATVGGSDLLVTHYGYQAPLAQGRPRRERNLRLLRAALAREPDDWYWHFQLGVTLKPDDPSAAVTHLARALSLGEGTMPATVRREIHTRLAQLALQGDDPELTLQQAGLALDGDPANLVARVCLVTAALGLGRFAEALPHLEFLVAHALDQVPNPGDFRTLLALCRVQVDADRPLPGLP